MLVRRTEVCHSGQVARVVVLHRCPGRLVCGLGTRRPAYAKVAHLFRVFQRSQTKLALVSDVRAEFDCEPERKSAMVGKGDSG